LGGEANPYRYVLNSPLGMIDPSGLYPKVVCPSNPQRQRDLIGAVKQVCDALTTSGESGLLSTHCLNHPGQEQCLVDWCNDPNSEVRCANLATCNTYPFCAYSWGADGPGNPVFVCPIAWSDPTCKKWPCSSLVGNIVHEVVGLCGSPHEDGGEKFPDPCDFRANCLCKAVPGLVGPLPPYTTPKGSGGVIKVPSPQPTPHVVGG
jgi:hypothetical protein